MSLEKLRDSNIKLYLIATGAGAGIQNEIWKVPGCSSFFSGASFPYAPDKTIQMLGYEPKQFTSRETAIDLAVAAYKRALGSCDPQSAQKPVGMGVTASVTTLREHKGDHRYHACVITESQVLGYECVLVKRPRDQVYVATDRAIDGYDIDRDALVLLQTALGIQPDLTKDGHHAVWNMKVEDWSEQARKLFFEHPIWHPDGRREEYYSVPYAKTFFPGSFNPPHRGHIGIADQVESWQHSRPIFMIEAEPPHKEKLSIQEMVRRRTLLKNETVHFTSGIPLFLDKARSYPYSQFIIGADTYHRMLEPKWGAEQLAMLTEFKALGVRFHVFGRKGFESTRSNDLFFHHPGNWDVSSTELREKADK